jgi:hypothetical protein
MLGTFSSGRRRWIGGGNSGFKGLSGGAST